MKRKLLYARCQGTEVFRSCFSVKLRRYLSHVEILTNFFVQFDVENTGVSGKVLFVFCQIDELLLAKLGYLLLACNQSFSTFPIWFWDISDLYIFDDLVLTWWIVFIVMEALPCPYLKYLMIIFFEVFGLLGSFSTYLVFLLYTPLLPEVWGKILYEFFLWAGRPPLQSPLNILLLQNCLDLYHIQCFSHGKSRQLYQQNTTL